MVGVLCLAMLGFAFVWAVHNAVQGFGGGVKTDASVSAEASDSSPSDSTSSDTSEKSESEDASDTDDSAASQADASEDESAGEDSPIEYFPAVDDIDDDFGDAVFIGNSRTVGLGMNCGKPLATFYASTGLNVDTIATSATINLDNGTKGTVYDALGQKQFRRVFIMFGINEIGWPYWDGFETRYEAVIERVRALQPEAKIYVQSVLPVNSLAVNKDPVFTTENVDAINEYVRRAAEAQGAIYLDVNSVFREADGSLPMDAAPTDGIHMVKKYCLVWLKYLADNT